MTLLEICRELEILNPDDVTSLEIAFRASSPTTVTICRQVKGKLGGTHSEYSSLMYLSKQPVSECVWEAVCEALGLSKDVKAIEAVVRIDKDCRAFVEMGVKDIEGIVVGVVRQREGEGK